MSNETRDARRVFGLVPLSPTASCFLVSLPLRRGRESERLCFNRRSPRALVGEPRPRFSVAPEVATRLPLGLRTEGSATPCAHREIQAHHDARPTSLC